MALPKINYGSLENDDWMGISQEVANSSVCSVPVSQASSIVTNGVDMIQELLDISLSEVYDTTTGISLVTCTKCNIPIVASKAGDHIQMCEKIKNGTFRKSFDSESKPNISPGKPSAVKEGLKSEKSKKRGTSGEESSDTAKKPKRIKGTSSRPRKAIDLDRQCGVISGSSGAPCTRFIICKSHSVTSKRAVEGRSRPFDVLLAEYQSRNSTSTKPWATDSQSVHPDLNNLRSDDEVALIVNAVSRNRNCSSRGHQVFPVKLKSRFYRAREMFAAAVGGWGLIRSNSGI